MLRLPVEHALDGSLPPVHVESGQPVHEIDAHVGEAGGARGVEGLAGRARRVQASQALQHRVVERLHAQADAGDAGPSVGGEGLHGHALGIALHGDLGAGGDGEARAQAVEDGGQLFGGEQRGGPAPEEEAVEPDVGRPRRRAEQRRSRGSARGDSGPGRHGRGARC